MDMLRLHYSTNTVIMQAPTPLGRAFSSIMKSCRCLKVLLPKLNIFLNAVIIHYYKRWRLFKDALFPMYGWSGKL